MTTELVFNPSQRGGPCLHLRCNRPTKNSNLAPDTPSAGGAIIHFNKKLLDPPYQTCHRRFQRWVQLGVFKRIAQQLAQDLYERGGIDIREAFIDGTLVPAKKMGLAVGKTKRGKGTKITAIADVAGFPVSANIESASPHEVNKVGGGDDRQRLYPTCTWSYHW